MTDNAGQPSQNVAPAAKLYSLWIVPPADLAERLRRVIDDVATRYGGPAFAPHVTLSPNLSGSRETVAEVAARVAAETAPFDMTLADLATSNSYYFCVFHPVRARAALEAAYDAVRRELEPGVAGPYRPHLSVAYGLVEDEDRRHVAAAFNGDAGVSFPMREIELVETSQALAPHEWRRLETFPVRGV